MLTQLLKTDYKSVPMQVLNAKNFGLTAAKFEILRLRLREKGDETLVKKIFETQYAPCRDLLMKSNCLLSWCPSVSISPAKTSRRVCRLPSL